MEENRSAMSLDEQKESGATKGDEVVVGEAGRREENGKPAGLRHVLSFALRLLILGIVGFFFWVTLSKAWEQVVDSEVALDWRKVSWGMLALSVPSVMAGLIPSCFAWQKILDDFGQKIAWKKSFYAYFLGHFGKYVPGKAMAVILRVGALHRHGVAVRPAVVSVFIETLTGIASGALLGAILLQFTALPSSLRYVALACIPFAIVALLPHPFRWFVHRVAKSRIGKMPPKIADAINGRMMIRTVLTSILGWLLQGTALWLVLQALCLSVVDSVQGGAIAGGLPQVGTFQGWIVCVASMSLGAFVGFLSLLPGGAVARELASTWVLSSIVPQPIALLATVIVRLTSILAEMTMIFISWVVQRSGTSEEVSKEEGK